MRLIKTIFLFFCVSLIFYAAWKAFLPRLTKDEGLPLYEYAAQREKRQLSRRSGNDSAVLREGQDELLPLKIELLGTILRNGDDSLVWIRHTPTAYEAYYKIGDRIKDARISAIGRANMELTRANGKKEVFLLVEEGAPAGQTKILNAKKIISEYNKITAILKEVAFLPEISSGKIKGFRVVRMDEASFTKQIGLKEGDVINKVNGYPLSGPKQAVKLYEELKQKYSRGELDRIDVSLKRGGSPRQLSFTLK